jgi:cobalt/nickel transport system permease protein
MAVAIIRLAGIPGKIYLKLILLPFLFLLIGVLTIAVSITAKGTVTGWLTNMTISGVTIGVTYDGLVMAGGLFCKSLGAVSCLYFLSLTTPAVEMVSVMRRLKFPSLFIELADLIYRFIFVMLETADDIYTSQSSRLGYASLKNSMKRWKKMSLKMKKVLKNSQRKKPIMIFGLANE